MRALEIIPVICTLINKGQYPAFLHPESFQAQLGVATEAEDLAVGSPFVSILSSLTVWQLQHDGLMTAASFVENHGAGEHSCEFLRQ